MAMRRRQVLARLELVCRAALRPGFRVPGSGISARRTAVAARRATPTAAIPG